MRVQVQDYKFFEKLLTEAKNILVITKKSPDIDTLAAALFLENTLSSLGKSVQIVAKGNIPEFYNHFSKKIFSKIEPKRLIVSFNWKKNEIEKVGYDMDEENFNIIITPRAGEIKKEDISISHRGKSADLIITLALASLDELDLFEQNFLAEKAVVDIDKSERNQYFGRLNFVDEKADSICALVAKLFDETKIQVPQASADFLLDGMRSATDNFTSVSDPATFESAAITTRIKRGLVKEPKGQETPKSFEVPKEWLAPKVFRSKQETS